jgi:adenine deaminase
VDLLLKDALVYSSAYRCFLSASVAIKDGKVLYVGSDANALDHICPDATQSLDNCWLIPGLIDIHMHIESSMISPSIFAHTVLRHGTTTCVAEPHEIANVFGVEGINEFMRMTPTNELDSADIFFGIPSSVPSTDLEDAGSSVTPDDVRNLMENPRVRCLGEVMDCQTVVKDPSSRAAQVVRAALNSRLTPIIEGHVPGFTGLELARILYAGIDSDHCEQTPERMRERFEMGMFVEIQDKSCSPAVIEWLAEHPQLAGLWSFVTDDVMADRLCIDHLAGVVRHAIKLGLSVENAIYGATTSPAMRMDLRDRGKIAPGRLADFVVLDDLSSFHVKDVYRLGHLVCREDSDNNVVRHDFPKKYYLSVHLEPLSKQNFELYAPTDAKDSVCVRVMKIQRLSTFTCEQHRILPIRDGRVCWKDTNDLVLAQVFERHHKTGLVGTALLSGCCLHRGAVATTWAHDHHNLLVIGCDEHDMAVAANAVISFQGGIAVVENGAVVAKMPLQVAGILTEVPLKVAGTQLSKVTYALKNLGWSNANPIMSMGTVALPVSPELKVTDRGLIDVRSGSITSLFINKKE